MKALISASFILISSLSTSSANLYWVGAGDNNWNNTANWSTSSGGGGGASIPGASDLAIFDGNGNVNCNLNSNINVNGFDIQLGYTATITQNSGITITIGTSNFSQDNGTFVGGDAKVDINGSFTLSNGSFTATSDTTFLKGDFTHTAGGTFNHNNGTFYFDGSLARNYNVNNNESFFDVVYNNSHHNDISDRMTFGVNDTLTVLNDFSWINGDFIEGFIDVRGDIEIFSNATGDYNSISTLMANGTGAQSGILHAGGACSKLHIINSQATFNTTGTGTFTIRKGLQMDVGTFNLGTLNLTVISGGITQDTGVFNGSTGGFISIGGSLILNSGNFTTGTDYTFVSGNYTQTNGNFSANGEYINIDGDFTISGGTHTATSDTTFLKGDFTHTAGGTFSHNNGTFYFDGAQSRDYNVNNNENFFNVVYNNTHHNDIGDRMIFGVNDTLTVLNDFSWINGDFIEGFIDVRGDIEIFSNATGDYNSISTLMANGTGAQSGILHAGGACSKLHIINNNATFNTTGTGTFTIRKGLQMDVGTFNLGTLNLTVISGGITQNTGVFNGSTGGFISIGGSLTLNNGSFTTGTDYTFVSSNYTQTNGTFSANGEYINIDGDFTISGGTHTATSDTTFLKGDFTHTAGGTFSHNNGTFYFDGAQSRDYNVNNNENFFNVVYNNTHHNDIGDRMIFGVNDTLTVLNDFSWINGDFIEGFIDVRGDIEIFSNATGDYNSISTLMANGTGAQSGILHAGGACSKLHIINSQATFNTTGTGTFTIRKGLQMDAGTFNLGTLNLTVISGGITQNTGVFNGSTGGFISIGGSLTLNNGTFTTGTGYTFISSNYTQTNGTFSANGEYINIDGAFTLSGGTYTATSDTTYLERNYTHTTGGTFNHNNGTFILDDQNDRTIDVNNSELFFNLTYNNVHFNPLNDDLHVGAGDTITTLGTLSLTNGETNNGFFNAKGDVNISPAYSGGNTALIFSGSTSQNLNNVGAEGNFNGDVYIDMNGASDSVVLASNFIFDGTGQDLIFVKGRFNTTSSKKIIMHDGRTVSGASDSSFVDGPFMKIGNDAFTFPTGDSSSYLPIAISAPSNVTDTFTAQYFQVNPDPPYDRSLTDTTMAVSACEYWNLNRNAGGSDVTVTLSWKDYAPGQPCSGVADLPGLRVARWDGAQWVNEKNLGTTGNTSAGTIDSRIVNAFGPFTLASQPGLNPLPVEITQFDAEEMDNVSVLVSWTTEVEISNHYFLVQRSTDLVNWEDVSTVLSQAYFNSGNSSAPLHYETYDFAPHFGTSYYRLKQFDINGDTDIPANPESVYFQGLEIINVYPNPAENQMNYIVNVHTEGDLDVFVYDSKGRVVSKETFNIEWGINRFTMDVSRFADGVYLLKVATPDHKHYDFKQFITNRP